MFFQAYFTSYRRCSCNYTIFTTNSPGFSRPAHRPTSDVETGRGPESSDPNVHHVPTGTGEEQPGNTSDGHNDTDNASGAEPSKRDNEELRNNIVFNYSSIELTENMDKLLNR